MIPLEESQVVIASQVVDDAARPDPYTAPKKAPAAPKVSRSVVRPAAVPAWVKRFAECVISHESRHAGMYTAENPVSTASGAYQFIDGTWQTLSRQAGHAGWSHAAYAPPRVQDAVFYWTVLHGGAGHWKGTGCGYGT